MPVFMNIYIYIKNCFVFSFVKQDTKMVAAASIDRIVHVWSTQTHELLHRLDGHTESVYAVTFSHEGDRLVSGGLDKTIKVQ